MTRRKAVRNLVIVSDTHCGDKLALYPPDYQLRLDDGGRYRASDLQVGLWAYWREFWDEWVPTVTHDEPFDLLHNGDVIEGVHHRATHPISQNIKDQLRIAEAAFGPEVQRCRRTGGTYYHVRGTAAHVGESSVWEETLAETLGAKPNAQGQYARYDLWKRVGRALVHAMHHIGTTSSAAHEASAVNAELTAEYVEAARWRREPPDFVVRSHRHRSIAVDLDSAKGYAAAIVTPAWQGKTPFAWKIAGARISEPQFGGIIIRHGDEEFHYRRRVWSLERSSEE
jgi:hypothetical protein